MNLRHSHKAVNKLKKVLTNSTSTESLNKLGSLNEIKTEASTIASYSLNYSEKDESSSKNLRRINLESSKIKEPIKLVAYEMGTTANVVLFKNSYLYIANVGDSLAVMFKNGIAEKLTTEHKVSLENERSRIVKSGARIINNRIEGRLNLTRAIGIN